MAERALAVGGRSTVIDPKRPGVKPKLEHSREKAPRRARELMANQQTATASVLSIVSTNNNSNTTTKEGERAKGDGRGEESLVN